MSEDQTSIRYGQYLSALTLEAAIADLREALTDGQDTFLYLEDDLLERPLGTGKWTPKETVGHLIDSAGNNWQRFVRAQIPAHLTDGVLISPGYAQNEWVALQRYNERDRLDLIELWAALNEQILHIMEGVNPESLQTPCIVGGGSPMTLKAMMMDYVGHLKHHLEQLPEAEEPA